MDDWVDSMDDAIDTAVEGGGCAHGAAQPRKRFRQKNAPTAAGIPTPSPKTRRKAADPETPMKNAADIDTPVAKKRKMIHHMHRKMHRMHLKKIASKDAGEAEAKPDAGAGWGLVCGSNLGYGE